jgi:DNA-binding NarL/FixJ family response regulator
MLRTLLVEDNQVYRQTLKRILSTAFPAMHVDEAGDGKTALRKIAGDRPALIFMDIKLPEGNGLELTKEIKSLYPEIAVIILTSYDSKEYREAASQAGAEYFLSKKSASSKDITHLVGSVFSRDGMPHTEGRT